MPTAPSFRLQKARRTLHAPQTPLENRHAHASQPTQRQIARQARHRRIRPELLRP